MLSLFQKVHITTGLDMDGYESIANRMKRIKLKATSVYLNIIQTYEPISANDPSNEIFDTKLDNT